MVPQEKKIGLSGKKLADIDACPNWTKNWKTHPYVHKNKIAFPEKMPNVITNHERLGWMLQECQGVGTPAIVPHFEATIPWLPANGKVKQKSLRIKPLTNLSRMSC